MIYEYARYSRAKASIPLVMADYKNSFVTTNSVLSYIFLTRLVMYYKFSHL